MGQREKLSKMTQDTKQNNNHTTKGRKTESKPFMINIQSVQNKSVTTKAQTGSLTIDTCNM